MSDFLAGMGLQRRANEGYEDRQRLIARAEQDDARRVKDDAFLETTRAAQTENLGLQRRATQMQLEQSERLAKMQEAIRGAFSQGGGYAEIAKIAQEHGDLDTYTKVNNALTLAKKEGLTELLRRMKLGDTKGAAEVYRTIGQDRDIEDLRIDEKGGLRVRRKGGEESWGNFDALAQSYGVSKVEWEDGQEYVNGQPTGKFAPPNPNDKDRWKPVKNADGSGRLVDTHSPASATQRGPTGVSKDGRDSLVKFADTFFKDPGDTAEETQRAAMAKSRASAIGFSEQILQYNGDLVGMNPAIAATVARDLVTQRRGPDGKLIAWRRRYTAPNGAVYDGVMYQHENGPRFYKFSDQPVAWEKQAVATESTSSGPQQQSPQTVPQAARDRLIANPDRVQEFDEVFGEGAGKRILDEHRTSQGQAPAKQAPVQKKPTINPKTGQPYTGRGWSAPPPAAEEKPLGNHPRTGKPW